MTAPDNGAPKVRVACSIASFLAGAGLQLSGYTNRAVAFCLFVATLALGVSSAVPYLSSRWTGRHGARTATPQPRPPRRRDDPGYGLLLPWVDRAKGQLVLTLQHPKSRADGTASTPAAWQCRVFAPGQTAPAVADDRHADHRPVPWKLVVEYPRDFAGAAGPLASGRYEATWVTLTFNQRLEQTGEHELARRSFVVTGDGKVEPAPTAPTSR